MDKKDRTETINILDWLEEDTKQELRKEERADYLKIKTKLVKLKTDAILEMYRSIQGSKDDRDKCLEALGKVHLYYRLGFITKNVYSEHRDYLLAVQAADYWPQSNSFWSSQHIVFFIDFRIHLKNKVSKFFLIQQRDNIFYTV